MNIKHQIFLNRLITAYSRVMPNRYIKSGYTSIDFLIYVGLLNEQKLTEFLDNKIEKENT